MDKRKFGVGNISLANGTPYPKHNTHKTGLEADIRLLRIDGHPLPVTRFMAEYDRAATAKLIALFFGLAQVELIYFNDAWVPRVRKASNHDDHFHVKLRVPT